MFCLHEFVNPVVCFPDGLSGYRYMHRLLLSKHRVTVSQETVRYILRQLDPVSVSSRRQHRLRWRTYVSCGPNYCWHVDGYDKLRPYGILISGYNFQLSRKSCRRDCCLLLSNNSAIPQNQLADCRHQYFVNVVCICVRSLVGLRTYCYSQF